jgi:hypothetical protein
VQAYNYEVRDQFIDINKTAKEQVEGVQNLIEVGAQVWLCVCSIPSARA